MITWPSWIAMIARQATVGPDAGMPMQIDKPRRDEAVGGDKRAVHGLRVGLAVERDAITSQTTTPSRISTWDCSS
jgi:hypothetical protein